ncbi:hypothetical protein ACTXT7_007962 [Hymenolepis weldensis]
MEETVTASISLEKDVYCLQADSIPDISVEAVEIKPGSEENSVTRKAMKFVKTKWPSSCLKKDSLDLFHCRKATPIVDSCLTFSKRVITSSALK